MSDTVAQSSPDTTENTEKSQDGFSLLKKLAGAPDQNQISTWKTQYGDIFMSGFTEQELYVWRALSRGEWRELQSMLQSEQMDQMQYEERMVKICLLWSPVDADPMKKAGTVSTMAEQVMQRSNFVSPQAAAQLVLKL